MSRITLARDTIHLNTFLVCLGRKTTGILKQRSQALTFTHLVSHRTLDLACDVHKTVIRTYDNNVIIFQTDITSQLPVKDIVINVNHRQLTTASVNLDIAKRTNTGDTACHINGMEHSGKGR